MPTSAQEKLPGEKIRIQADFSSSLLNGESLVSGNVTVTCVNALTDVNSAGTILSGAPTITNPFIYQDVQAGADGDVHLLTFSTGATNLGLGYKTQIHLLVTNTPASENPLCTRDEVKRKLRVEDDSDNALIDDLIASASEYLRRRCGRDFHYKQYTQVVQPLCGEDNVRIKLHNWPVKRVERVDMFQFDGQTIASWTDASQWDVLDEGWMWFNDGTVFEFWPNRNIITYRAGYVKIPEDLREAAKSLAIWFYRLIGKEGLTEERIGDYMYARQSLFEFPQRVRRELADDFIEGVISRYRRHEMGYNIG